MDKNTYSNCLASQILVDILNKRQDKKLIMKVSSCLHDYYSGLKEIKKTNIQLTFAEMWKNKFICRINNYSYFDVEIKNFMKNVIVTEYRKIVNENK